MTRDQTPPEDNSPPAQNSPADWESRMARLVGLEESQSPEEDSTTTRQSQLSEPEEPQEVQTRSPLSSNPFAKLGLVGAGTLALVVFAGVFLTFAIPGDKKPRNPNRNLVVREPRSQPTTKPIPQQQQEEIEALKTKLALAEQAQAVQAAQQQLRNQKPAPPPRITAQPTPRRIEPPRVVYRERPPVAAQRTPTPVQTVYVPRPVPVERPARVVLPTRVPPRQVATSPARTQRTLPPVLPPIQPPPAIPNTPPPVATTPPPTPDPLQEWARLAKLGSYGQVSNSKNQGTVIAQANTIPAPQPLTVTRPPIRIVTPPSPRPITPAVKQNSKSTVVGSSAKAVLVTAVYGETTRETPASRNNRSRTNNNNNSNSDSSNDSGNKEVFKARLTEPLKAADGSVILPKDAELFFNNDYTSEQGLMRVNIFKVSWKEKGNVIEKSVPPGNLTLRGPSSQPLVAEQQQNRGGSRFASDVKLGILGGIGKAAENINRPESKLVPLNSTNYDNNNNPIGTTTTTAVITENRRDIAAGVLEGATRAIVPEVSRRIQQQNPPRGAQRTNIWVMSAGKEVQLFVNGQIQL